MKERRAKGARTQADARGRAPRANLERWFLPAVFLIAAAWRLAYLDRLSSSPLAGTLFDDARVYWVWSERIAAGHILGTNPFFLAPLYPYVLAGLRALQIHSPSEVLVVQALWGAAAVTLLADAARRLTGPGVAVAVATILCFYEMAVFFDGLVLTESLLFFLESLLLWWVIRREGDLSKWAVAGLTGLLVGLLTAGRGSLAVILAPAALLVLRRPRRLGSLAALLFGFLLVLLPIALHNQLVAREWIPLTYNSGFNLFVGNNPKATGTYVPITAGVENQPRGIDGGIELDGREFLERTAGLSLSPAQSSRHWSRAAAEFVGVHPGRVLELALRKIAMLWNAREYPQIENVEEYRQLAGPLGIPFLGAFALLGVLALAGAYVAVGGSPARQFVLGCAVAITVATVPFFVVDRYRHQLLPVAALLAAMALYRLRIAWTMRQGRLAFGAALAAGLVIVSLPLPGPTAERRAALLASNMGGRLIENGWEAVRAGRFEEAERDFTKAVETVPRRYDAWGALVQVQIQLGQTESAGATLARARSAGLPEVPTLAYQALLAALARDTAASRAALDRIPPGSLDSDPNLASVVENTRRLLARRP